MTDLEEICKKLILNKQIQRFEEEIFDGDSSIGGSNVEISNHGQDCLSTPESILDMISKVFMEIQRPMLNVSVSSCQTEPLDLSQKQTSIENQSRGDSLPKRMWKPKTFEFEKFFSMFIKRFTANDVCSAHCQMLYKDHYHCYADNGHCTAVMKGKDQLRQHGKRHAIAEELTKLEFSFCVGCSLTDSKSHYHCSHQHCDFISTHMSNMDRLQHVESTHCVIITKRTNNHSNTATYCNVKRRRKTPSNNLMIQRLATADIWNQLSPISTESSENQFVDFNADSSNNTISESTCPSLIDDLSSAGNNTPGNMCAEEAEAALSQNTDDSEKNFHKNGGCSRLFCNLKKVDHYHCPVCDRGSSKKDLYLRHLKQRHK